MIARFRVATKIKSDLRKIIRHLIQIISDLILIMSQLVLEMSDRIFLDTIFIVHQCRRKGNGAVWGFRSP